MIYTFDKKQNVNKIINSDSLTEANLKLKINEASTFEFSVTNNNALDDSDKYIALPHPLDNEKFLFFRLTEKVNNEFTVDYTAYEYAYQELSTYGYIEDKRPDTSDAKTLMNIALDGSDWILNNYNVSGTAKTNFYYVDHLTAISQVVKLLGGEIIFYIQITGNKISGKYMDYLYQQGQDTSKIFSAGSNLLSVTKQQRNDSIYTAILPRGKGEIVSEGTGDTPDGYGRRINISDVEWKKSNGNPLDKPKGDIILEDPTATSEWGQINGNARLLIKEYDEIDDVNTLIQTAYKDLISVNHPQIEYSASVAEVGDLSLGDTVIIMHRKNGLSYKTRVFEVDYDLLHKENTTISLGDDLSSNSITSTINSISSQASTTSEQTQWTINNIGRTSTTYGANAPESPQKGDVWFKYYPNGDTEIWRYDGEIWVKVITPTTGQDISDAVDEAVAQANKNAADAIAENNEAINSTMQQVAKEQADIAIADGDFNNKAQAMADKALSDAKANTATVAQETLNSANQNLADAKKSVTEDIAREASDRASAVSALDTKAQGYVSAAKSDINDTINALSVGGRNYVLNTNVSTTSNITGFYSSVPSSYFNNKKLTVSVQLDYDNITALSERKRLGVEFAILNKDGSNILVGSWKYPTIGDSFHGRIYTTWDFSNNEFKDYATNQMVEGIYVQGVTGTNVSVSKPKLEIGNKATDWTQAPEDVVLDYTTKDEKIKTTISQYQETNDGNVSKAQTDATTALGEIEKKVSLTVYNQKTGELSKTINETKDTADKSAQTIADIQEADGKRDSKISEVEKTAGEIKSTVSELSTTQGKQSGDISTLKQRADGFDATVTKVDNLAVGGRNLLLNSVFTAGFTSWNNENSSWTVGSGTYDGKPIIKSPTTVEGGSRLIQTIKPPLSAGTKLTVSFNAKGTAAGDKVFITLYNLATVNSANISLTTDMARYSFTMTIPTNFPSQSIYFWNNTSGDSIYLNEIKLEIGTLATDWSPAPEDVDSATAKAQLTADNAALAVTKLTNADGIITKAQADIRANADAITKTVSKTVYDQKTDELNQAISKAQSTADGVVTTVGNYQTSNDKRVKAAESAISQNADAIALKVAKTDYDNNNSNLNTRFTKVEATANGASTTVSELKNTVNNLGQINQLFNTEFSPDLQGWSSSNLSNYLDYIDIKGVYNSSHVLHYNGGTTARLDIQSQKIKIENPAQTFSISVLVKGKVGISIVGYKSDSDVAFSSWYTATAADSNYSDWTLLTFNNKSIISGSTAATTSIAFNITSTGNEFWLSEPMLVFASTVGTYVQGNYNNNAALASQQITIDGLTDTVSNPNTGLSTRVQTAEGMLSTVKSTADGAMSKASQTANDITQEIKDRGNGDSNTLKSAKDFTQSSITTSETGMKSFITQTSNSVIAQVNSINLINNSEFDDAAGSLAGWHIDNPWGATVTNQLNQQDYAKATVGKFIWTQYSKMVYHDFSKSTNRIYSDPIKMIKNKKLSGSITVSNPNGSSSGVGVAMYVVAFDANRNYIGNIFGKNYTTISSDWTVYNFDGLITPDGTAYVSIYFTWSNGIGYFGQPMLQINDTYTGYSPNVTATSTVLSLFKDNWSIGIADNISKITSGIVANADSMSLINKNIVLDGNTTVTGDFYAKGGNFTNLNATNITVGTLNGNQVNITNVNAANITGDITNFIQSNWNGLYQSTYITSDGMTVSSGTVTTSFGSQGMRITMGGNGGVVMQGSTKSNGTQTGVLIGMNVGSTFTSFGFQSSSNYLYNDEMVILKTGSKAAADYNIGGGVAFNHNVSFMDNIYMKYGKGFYGKWGDPQQAIFFQTINSGIPAIMHISGAGIAFGHGGDLYMLSHGGWQDFNNSNIKGSYTVDQPWITG